MSRYDTRPRPTETPWWDDYTVERHLHHAASQGAEIMNLAEFASAYWGDLADEDDFEDAWFLNVDFGTKARVMVRYTSERGFWRLLVDTEETRYFPDVDDELATALAVAYAAKMCRDLNTLIVRDRRRERQGNGLSEEIEALMGDRELTPKDVAAHLAVSPGVFMSKLAGSTHWSAVDLARLAKLFDRDVPSDTLERLLEAVDR